MSTTPLQNYRAVGAMFFLFGLCFASWGSRIPAIQAALGLSEPALGSLLMALPFGSMCSIPVSTFIIKQVGSKRALVGATLCYCVMLVAIGYCASVLSASICLFVFGLLGNMMNISNNTQAVQVEASFGKSVMASLHGLWSLAGFVGAAIGAGAIALQLSPFLHFLGISLFAFGGVLVCQRWLLREDLKPTIDGPPNRWPSKRLIILGAIAFCSMICEGTMLDWSGVYFEQVIQVKPALVGVGYAAFMSTMAGTRFVVDRLTSKHGVQRVLIVSGVMVFLGLLLVVFFPSFYLGIISFMLVGMGTSAVVPSVFSEAGKTRGVSASYGVTVVTTIGFMGFLIGPPLVGWVAGLANLQVSFFIVSLLGFSIFLLSRNYGNTFSRQTDTSANGKPMTLV